MNIRQQLSIVAFLVILGCVYLFGKTKDPALSDHKAAPRAPEIANHQFDIETYMTSVRNSLSVEQNFKALLLDSLLEAATSETARQSLLDSAIAFYS